ncbi:MAG: hypothetical protein L3K09_05720 [Thermoplasmata archaeon]|nr:hypothetical protein [Thermoplasmata archaeon]
MANSGVTGAGTPPSISLGPEERRWLHDKYERLAAEEGQLAAGRTSYFAAIGSVLVTGTVVAVSYFSGRPLLLVTIATFLSAIGIVFSFVWAVLLHRTNDAQALWREAAWRLEVCEPPLSGELLAPITLRSTQTVTVNLLRPYSIHRARFSTAKPISWMDRVNPGRLTESLALTFLLVWLTVLVISWGWFVVQSVG